MVKTITDERRSSIRAKRVLSIEYRLFKPVAKTRDASWHLSLTEDMSIGGVAFYTEQEFKKGDVLDLRVVMSGVLDIFQGLAQVVRVDKKKAAAHFLVAVKFIDKKKARDAKSYSVGKRI